MEFHLLVTLLVCGHACLYLYLLATGQTVPPEARLRESWLFPGRPMGLPLERKDLPDWNCWMDWRGNAPLLLALFGAYLLLGKLLAGPHAGPDGLRSPRRRRYTHVSGLLFTAVMHGVGGAGLLAVISAANYFLAKGLVRAVSGAGSKSGRPSGGIGWAMLVIWAFNIPVTSLMFWLSGEDEVGAGVRLLRFVPSWLPLYVSFEGIGPWFSYRFMCLRFISFGCDALWAAFESPAQSSERSCSEASADFVARVTAESHSRDKYFGADGAWYYTTYVTYPPLFFIGPFLSYNGFVAQLDRPSAQRPARELAAYALVIAGYALALEVSMHFLYYPGWLSSETSVDVLLGMPLPEMAVAVHSLVNFEWTSLMVMWRMQRLVAQMDGVDTFENMTRNINQICSFQEMWRHWHVSINKFAVRYIYVPIGGKHRPLAGILATFLFVSFWHEVNGVGTAMHWYIWGGLNCICVVFEKTVVARLRPRSTLATGLLGAVTYQVMQWANIPAMMAWDVSYSLGVRLLQAWTVVLPPVLYGLQGILAAEIISAAKRGDEEKRTPAAP